MTPHVHYPAVRDAEVRAGAPAARGGSARPARPPWLLAALAVGIAAAALVLAGVIPLSTVLYAGLFGGMIFMHLGGHGGHGHGGHGGPRGQGDGSMPPVEDLREPSPGSQPRRSGSGLELDDRASNDSLGGGNDDHDQHSPHTCH